MSLECDPEIPVAPGVEHYVLDSLEPLRELETVRIKLVKDFIHEPMLFAKFPHPLNCILAPAL